MSAVNACQALFWPTLLWMREPSVVLDSHQRGPTFLHPWFPTAAWLQRIDQTLQLCLSLQSDSSCLQMVLCRTILFRFSCEMAWLKKCCSNSILLLQKTKFDNYVYTERILEQVEIPFTLSLDLYPTNTTGKQFLFCILCTSVAIRNSS